MNNKESNPRNQDNQFRLYHYRMLPSLMDERHAKETVSFPTVITIKQSTTYLQMNR